jgi:orotate phosphoribosyltransferase
MDLLLAEAIISLNVPQFGPNEKNKGDSQSCRFEPRNLLSSPTLLDHVGRALGMVVKERCRGSAIIGIATSGIAWATLASLYSRLPLLYVRKTQERRVSDKLIEGIPPTDRRVVLVDDLLFAGECKREAIEILNQEGYCVTDIVVIIDRELQRVKDGPRIQDEYELNLHSLITMTQIVDYMIERRAITPGQLEDLITDYRSKERWCLPGFARRGGEPGTTH